MSIYYASHKTGSGKTYGIMAAARKRASKGQNVLICQPTKRVIRETQSALSKDCSFNLRAITGTCTHSVGKDLRDYLENIESSGNILLCTHAAFFNLQYFPNPGNWHVFIDEMPSVVNFDGFLASKTHQFITDHLVAEPMGPTLSQLVVADPESLIEQIKILSNDENLNKYVKMARMALNPAFDMYVETSAYEALESGEDFRFNCMSILRAEALLHFRSATICCALFTETIAYKIWQKQGVTFSPSKEITPRYDAHPNGHLVDIYYLSDKSFSKRKRDLAGREVLNLAEKAVLKTFGDEDFVWHANKDLLDDDVFYDIEGAVRLPCQPHGSNRYLKHHNVVFLSALNPPSWQFPFYEAFGLSQEDIFRGIYQHQAYQGSTRISIRDLNNTNRKRIIVFDKATALWLAELLGTSSVTHIASGIDHCLRKANPNGRPKIHQNSANKTRSSRFRRLVNEVINEHRVGQCNETPNSNSGGHIDYENAFQCSIWSTLTDTCPFGSIMCISHDEFITILKESSKRKTKSKETNFLLSPSMFVTQKGTPTSRGTENVLFSNGIWLDVDGGDLTEEMFAKRFRKLLFVAFNSYNHTVNKRRWRIYIPTTDVMSAKEYALVTAMIVKEIERNGCIDHGIDSKRQASNLFYFPCQAADRSASFFNEYREGREPLNPGQWIGSAILAHPTEVIDRELPRFASQGPEVEMRIEQHLARWRTEGSQPGQGDREFFALGMALAELRLGLDDIKGILEKEMWHAQTPADRFRQIPRILARCHGLPKAA